MKYGTARGGLQYPGVACDSPATKVAMIALRPSRKLIKSINNLSYRIFKALIRGLGSYHLRGMTPNASSGNEMAADLGTGSKHRDRPLLNAGHSCYIIAHLSLITISWIEST